ncbi:MAG: hypothetical protein J7539_10355 [Niabella sp.]|nr:hypothetical protein [Niabella sp.]
MDLDNLIDNIRDFFLKQYNTSNNSGNDATYVAFEPLGHVVAPDDFKLNGTFNDTVAREQLSLIADAVPAIDALFIADGLNKFSDAYGNLLASVQFCDKNITGDVTPYLSLFGDIKSKAQQQFTSEASIEDPNMQIYVCNGSPGGWYDKDSAIWQHQSFTSTSSVTQTPAQPVLPVLWKLTPIQSKIADNPAVVKILNTPVIADKLRMLNIGALSIGGAATAIPAQHATTAPSLAIPMAAPLMTARAPQPIAAVSTNRPPTTVSTPPLRTINTGAASDAPMNKEEYQTINTALPLNKMVLLNRAIGNDNNTQTGTVDSKEFTMDFYYSLVYLNRPWVAANLLQEAKLWFAVAQKAGAYSSGADDNTNKGILRAVPKAMIVIRSLNITAQWSDTDKQAAGSAYGLGSFNITNSSFTNNTLTAPGIQIIGWVCEVLPELPVNDDVNFSDAPPTTTIPSSSS